MTVIESFTMGKAGDPSGGEDHIEITPHFYGLFDGVTSRGRAVDESLRFDDATPGRFAARTLGAALHRLDPATDMTEAFAFLQRTLAASVEASGVDPRYWQWPAAAQVAVFSRARMEIWRLGDISVAVNGRLLPASSTPIDDPATRFRAAALWALRASGVDDDTLRDNDPTWQMLLPLLELQHHLRNCDDPANPYAYWCMDGRPLPAAAASIFPVGSGDEVVFASDGYPVVERSLAASEAALEEILVKDPLLIELHLGFRPVTRGAVSFDDRAFLRFTA